MENAATIVKASTARAVFWGSTCSRDEAHGWPRSHRKSHISWRYYLRYDLVDEVDFYLQGLEDATDELDSRPALVSGTTLITPINIRMHLSTGLLKVRGCISCTEAVVV